MSVRRERRAIVVISLLLAVAFLLVMPAFPWLAQFTPPSGGGAPAADHWDFSAFPVVWNLNPQKGSNITGGRAVADVMQASFNTWQAAPNAALPVTRGSDVGDTSAGFSASGNNTNLICFVCQGDFTRDAETLAVTITTIENASGGSDGHGGRSRFAGQIIDADILFNPAHQFSTGAGGTGQDLQTVATHEVGHFFGLDHSAVVRAIMFPFAPPSETALSYDDVAGISQLYPKASADVALGTISGTVRFAGGGGVFGAHVFAESATGNQPIGGNIRKSPIGTMSLPDGSYQIRGVPPDSYIVVAEPLDSPVGNGDIQGYARAFGQGSVQTNFTTRWH